MLLQDANTRVGLLSGSIANRRSMNRMDDTKKRNYWLFWKHKPYAFKSSVLYEYYFWQLWMHRFCILLFLLDDII